METITLDSDLSDGWQNQIFELSAGRGLYRKGFKLRGGIFNIQRNSIYQRQGNEIPGLPKNEIDLFHIFCKELEETLSELVPSWLRWLAIFGPFPKAENAR